MDRLLQLLESFTLHLDPDFITLGKTLTDCLGDRAACFDMILLDQHAGFKIHTMIASATMNDCSLLQFSHAGCGFAGINNLAIGAGERFDIACGCSGDA